MKVVALNRTLDQELLALSRGASLECLVCGEFVMRTELGIVCPECGSVLAGRANEVPQLGVESG
jgi:Zn finger protein HypA/HybF involved in hydrogenase expression